MKQYVPALRRTRPQESIWPGILFIGVGVLEVYGARSVPQNSLIANDPMSSATLPTVVGTLIILTGGALLFRALHRARRSRERRTEAALQPTSAVAILPWLLVLGTLAACSLYGFVVIRLGFVISSSVLMVVLTALASHGRQRLGVTALLAVSVTLVCYLLFVQLLGVAIPAFP